MKKLFAVLLTAVFLVTAGVGTSVAADVTAELNTNFSTNFETGNSASDVDMLRVDASAEVAKNINLILSYDLEGAGLRTAYLDWTVTTEPDGRKDLAGEYSLAIGLLPNAWIAHTEDQWGRYLSLTAAEREGFLNYSDYGFQLGLGLFDGKANFLAQMVDGVQGISDAEDTKDKDVAFFAELTPFDAEGLFSYEVALSAYYHDSKFETDNFQFHDAEAGAAEDPPEKKAFSVTFSRVDGSAAAVEFLNYGEYDVITLFGQTPVGPYFNQLKDCNLVGRWEKLDKYGDTYQEITIIGVEYAFSNTLVATPNVKFTSRLDTESISEFGLAIKATF